MQARFNTGVASIPIFRWYKTTRSEKTSPPVLLVPSTLSFFPLHRAISTVEVIRSRGVQTHTHTHTHSPESRGGEIKGISRGAKEGGGIEWIFIVVALPRGIRGVSITKVDFISFRPFFPDFFPFFFLPFFLSFFPLFRGLEEWILYVYTGLPEGLDRETMKTRSGRY